MDTHTRKASISGWSNNKITANDREKDEQTQERAKFDSLIEMQKNAANTEKQI